MFNSKWKLALLLASLFASTTAFGDTILSCQGTVSRVYIDSAGNVLIYSSWRNDVTQICNLNGTLGSISSTNCSIYYSAFQTAYLNQKQVVVYYKNIAYTCTNLPTYSSTPLLSYMNLQ